jgi:hypothetical protein
MQRTRHAMSSMLAAIGIVVVSFFPAAAATQRATDTVVLTWEQCHIQTLREGFNPYQRTYVRHMMHCLGGKAK